MLPAAPLYGPTLHRVATSHHSRRQSFHTPATASIMPLLGEEQSQIIQPSKHVPHLANSPPLLPSTRKQSQHSSIAKTAIMSQLAAPHFEATQHSAGMEAAKDSKKASSMRKALEDNLVPPRQGENTGPGAALTDTPASTAPSSPRM